ncbi:hypothetical protein FACS1894130_02490 [Spirochaetia bacterium]|nr:hypothetical protein FACS1894130_02490 [Spirochaetia bacterium]
MPGQKEIGLAFNHTFTVWANKIKDHMRKLGEKHPIAIGDCNGPIIDVDLRDSSDYLCPHARWDKAALVKRENYTGPQFFQEVWLDRPFSPEGDAAQAEDIKRSLIDTFRSGLAGFAPWQWTSQLAMWQDRGTFRGENWDDMLGCCVRYDGTEKPAGTFFKDFIRLFGGLTMIQYNGNDTVKTGEGSVSFKPAEALLPGEHGMLLKQGEKVLRGIARSYSKGEGYSIETGTDTAVLFDFSSTEAAYIKAQGACTLKITLPKPVRKVFLADGISGKKLKALTLPSSAQGFELDFPLWQSYYWIKLKY